MILLEKKMGTLARAKDLVPYWALRSTLSFVNVSGAPKHGKRTPFSEH
ncbi:MAG: hypothetical protein ACE5H4_11310 [Candidatus Thorarchaeota archaeon]